MRSAIAANATGSEAAANGQQEYAAAASTNSTAIDHHIGDGDVECRAHAVACAGRVIAAQCLAHEHGDGDPDPEHRHESHRVHVEREVRGGKLVAAQPADQQDEDGETRHVDEELHAAGKPVAQQGEQVLPPRPHVEGVKPFAVSAAQDNDSIRDELHETRRDARPARARGSRARENPDARR